MRLFFSELLYRSGQYDDIIHREKSEKILKTKLKFTMTTMGGVNGNCKENGKGKCQMDSTTWAASHILWWMLAILCNGMLHQSQSQVTEGQPADVLMTRLFVRILGMTVHIITMTLLK